MNHSTIPVTELHKHLGATFDSSSNSDGEQGGTCRFSVWAPLANRVEVELVGQRRIVKMDKQDGFHVACVPNIQTGQRYGFRVDRGPMLPDPASRYQPTGVHGPSEVTSPRFDWRDSSWRGIATEDLVIYELHIGAFTEQGTFDAASERLDELVDLGVNAIELMPVADAAGRWNWGYDGVCLFAPNRNYGTPDAFRRLVDTAHRKGLAVILDVVYNHLGPEGNYLSQFGPYFSKKHHTPWGSAPNFDDPIHGEPTRRFFIANAIHWFDEYHIDGLRVDAIHCMRDDSEPHIACSMAHAVESWSRQSERPAMLIAESNVYDPQMLTPLSEDGIGFDAQWCDDFLHSVFAMVRPGEQLCHRVYRSASDLDQTLRMGHVYEGTVRGERGRQKLSSRVETRRLVYCIQNHDFIGNHPLGRRFHKLTSIDTQMAAAALLILSPAIPMLFMGEEFACQHPFRFFVDFTDESLRRAVVEGRKREYPQHDWTRGISPIQHAAFEASKIGPAEDGSKRSRDWYCALIKLRKEWQSQGLLDEQHLRIETDLDRNLFCLHYENRTDRGGVFVRLSPNSVDQSIPFVASGNVVLDSREQEVRLSELLPNHARVFQHSISDAS